MNSKWSLTKILSLVILAVSLVLSLILKDLNQTASYISQIIALLTGGALTGNFTGSLVKVNHSVGSAYSAMKAAGGNPSGKVSPLKIVTAFILVLSIAYSAYNSSSYVPEAVSLFLSGAFSGLASATGSLFKK